MSRPLPRFTQTALTHDPLEIMLAQRETEITRARTQIANGNAGNLADPADLRGIPCIANGVGGTQPHTDPPRETIARETRNIRRPGVHS